MLSLLTSPIFAATNYQINIEPLTLKPSIQSNFFKRKLSFTSSNNGTHVIAFSGFEDDTIPINSYEPKNSLFQSDDMGLSWHIIDGADKYGDWNSISYSQQNDKKLVAAVEKDNNLKISSDNGKTWKSIRTKNCNINEPIAADNIEFQNSMIFNNGNDDIIYYTAHEVSRDKPRFMFSTDGGVTCQQSDLLDYDNTLSTWRVYQSTDGNSLLGVIGTVARVSFNNGKNFGPDISAKGSTQYWPIVKFSPLNPQTAYILPVNEYGNVPFYTPQGYISLSHDRGLTWTSIELPRSITNYEPIVLNKQDMQLVTFGNGFDSSDNIFALSSIDINNKVKLQNLDVKFKGNPMDSDEMKLGSTFNIDIKPIKNDGTIGLITIEQYGHYNYFRYKITAEN